ncbi:MAG: hypothetical protein JXB07_04735 [Anaerolineae bacterium]|nr:hypothetical protein [Anaerolineae bacterium]
MKAFCAIYHSLLSLYPISFRANFGDEMEGVFTSLLKEKSRQGRWVYWRTFCKEIVSVPMAAVKEHLKMRGVSRMKKIVGLGLY